MKTNLLTVISTAAQSYNFVFGYGNGWSFEKMVNQADLSGGKTGLMLNINSVRQIQTDRAMWNGELEYDVQMFLFSKSEVKTQSSVGETLEQKMVNRLDLLQTELLRFIDSLTQCNNEIDLINPTYTIGVNVTATNIDGWFLDCTLRLSNQYP